MGVDYIAKKTQKLVAEKVKRVKERSIAWIQNAISYLIEIGI